MLIRGLSLTRNRKCQSNQALTIVILGFNNVNKPKKINIGLTYAHCFKDLFWAVYPLSVRMFTVMLHKISILKMRNALMTCWCCCEPITLEASIFILCVPPSIKLSLNDSDEWEPRKLDWSSLWKIIPVLGSPMPVLGMKVMLVKSVICL